MLLLAHEEGVQVGPSLAKVYRNQEAHDPSDLHRAREIASLTDRIPVGVLYRNGEVPRYEEVRAADDRFTPQAIQAVLEKEFDKFTIWPPE